MRRTGSLIAVTLMAGLGLAACGKSGGSQATGTEAEAPAGETTTAAPVAAAEPAAPAVTDEQKKALVAELPAPYNAGDIANGKKVFMVCKTCHTLNEGGSNMTGPNLWGVFGRKAGSAAGFNYSDGVKALGYTWDAQKIDTWITNPKAVVAETKMSFVGVKDAKDRADVIAYLKSETSAPK